MKQYHYSDGINSYGPVSLAELQSKNLSPETLIWSEDLVTWTKAREVPELATLFSKTADTAPEIPLPHPPPPSDSNFQRPPKSYLLESILTTLFCCWPLGIVSIVYASRVEKRFYAGDIRGAQEASANAKRWMIINLIVCATLAIGYLAIFGFALIGAW